MKRVCCIKCCTEEAVLITLPIDGLIKQCRYGLPPLLVSNVKTEFKLQVNLLWFQFVVSSDGAVGLCYEHSTAEGSGILNLVDEFIRAVPIPVENVAGDENAPKEEISKPIRLEWVLNDDAREAVAKASTTIDR